MLRPSRFALAGAICALALVLTGGARAEVVEPPVQLAGYANGIVGGLDGNVYVVEPGARSVAVLKPDGALIRQVGLPGAAGIATSAAVGPDGKVWVALGGNSADRGFARIDQAGVQTPLSTSGVYSCGPVGMAIGSAVRMLFSAPNPAGACVADGVGGIDSDGGNAVGSLSRQAFDLAVARGKLFVPDFGADTVTRHAFGAAGINPPEATFTFPLNSSPDGIELGDDGQLYVTLYNSGQVARFDPNANGTTAGTIVANDLAGPFGLARGKDGAIWVASQDARLVRIAPDGSQRSVAMPAGFNPWQVAAVGNDIWVTDNVSAKAIRIRNAGMAEPVPAAPAPPAPVVPAPAPVPAPPAPAPVKKPVVTDLLSLASTSKCVSRRRLTITVRKAKAGAAKVTAIKVTVGKGKAKSYSGKRLKVPVTLTGLPKGTFKVRLAVKLSNGATVTQTRTYRTCATKKR